MSSKKPRPGRDKPAKLKAIPADTPGLLGRPRFKLRRYSISLVVAMVAIAVLIMGYVENRRPPRLTLENKSGGTLQEIRVEFPGGVLSAPALLDGAKTTFQIVPLGPPPADGAGPKTSMILRLKEPDGSTVRVLTRDISHTRGAHERFVAVKGLNGHADLVRAPDEAQAGGGLGGGVAGLLRRIGINF